MFKLALVALLCITLTSANTGNEFAFQKFMEFTNNFNKVYATPEEFSARFTIFKNNLLEVLASNKFSSSSHTKGINQFSDLTFEEFKAGYLNLKVPQNFNAYCNARFTNLRDAPASFDWRDQKKVSPVKNQKSCGSCWTFSVVAMLESQSLINGKSDLFSEQQIVDCDKNNYGCNGGWPQVALQYLQGSGIESESAYPYKAVDQKCSFDKTKVIAHTSDVKCWENPTVATLQSQLFTIGPLSIVVDATNFSSYSSGLLNCTRNTSMNHAVLLVGYTQDSWIIKNSWGPAWGEKGFIRVSNVKGKNCLVGSYMVASKLS